MCLREGDFVGQESVSATRAARGCGQTATCGLPNPIESSSGSGFPFAIGRDGREAKGGGGRRVSAVELAGLPPDGAGIERARLLSDESVMRKIPKRRD